MRAALIFLLIAVGVLIHAPWIYHTYRWRQWQQRRRRCER